MKKFMFFLFPILILILSSSVTSYRRGYYNTLYKTIVCHSISNCYHEIGHAIDDALRWPSKSMEYQDTLEAYTESYILRENQNERDPLAEEIIVFPGIYSPRDKDNNPFDLWFWNGGWGGPTELYADMLAWAQGNPKNMPGAFRDFYDWDLAKKLISKYIGE